jgi:UDP-N-acetyl-D-galactosamine dehydrogenase
LTHKATVIGYHPEMILAGRRINDGMAAYVAQQVIKLMTGRRIMVAGSRILVLGLAFKENCPDLRNSKVADVVAELKNFDAKVDVYDPWVDGEAAQAEYGFRPIETPEAGKYDAIVLAVGHELFRKMGSGTIRKWGRQTHVLFDVKYMFPADQTDGRL